MKVAVSCLSAILRKPLALRRNGAVEQGVVRVPATLRWSKSAGDAEVEQEVVTPKPPLRLRRRWLHLRDCVLCGTSTCHMEQALSEELKPVDRKTVDG